MSCSGLPSRRSFQSVKHTPSTRTYYLGEPYNEQGSIVVNLEEAITPGRAALELCPPGDCCRAAIFSNLAMSLSRGFLNDSEEVDLVLSKQRLHHLPRASHL